MSVVTLEQLKSSIGIPLANTTEDVPLQLFLDGVEEGIWNWLGRYRVPNPGNPPHNPFAQLQTTEFYDGTDRQYLILKRRPVISVQGVWVDRQGYYGTNANGFTNPDTAWTIGQDFAPSNVDESEGNGGMLCAFAGSIPTWQGQAQRNPGWPRGQGNIKVTYTAGYTTFPMDLVVAICLVASGVRNSAARGTQLASETIGRYAYQLLDGSKRAMGTSEFDDIGQAKSTLARYREVNL